MRRYNAYSFSPAVLLYNFMCDCCMGVVSCPGVFIYSSELCTNGDARITGHSSNLIGRVEVCVNRTWGTVCEQGWSDPAAAVLCRQMGHSSNGMILTSL